jgi:DNA-binding MarR family transcriptional regulator
MESISGASADACAGEILEVVPAVMRAIRAQMRGHSEELPSVVHFRALLYVSRNPGSDVSGVAAHIGLMLPAASKLVQVLLTRGYVERSADPADRRRAVLRPTAKGRRVVEAARRATREYLAELLKDLDGPTRARVAGAMRVLRPIFAAEGGGPAARPLSGDGGGDATSVARRGRGRRRRRIRTSAS